jgi:hypothetical protein
VDLQPAKHDAIHQQLFKRRGRGPSPERAESELVGAEAQDVDVPGNLTMHNSTDPTVGQCFEGLRALPSQLRNQQHFPRQQRRQFRDERTLAWWLSDYVFGIS